MVEFFRQLRRKLFQAILLVVVFLCISISCNSRDDAESLRVIEIEKNIKNFQPFKLSDLDCELEYIVLETAPDAMLMTIAFVDISDKHIIVADRDKCLLFSRSGKFISKIGSKGRGPGENTAFTQIKIHNDRNSQPVSFCL
jgi:hypothetical protein